MEPTYPVRIQPSASAIHTRRCCEARPVWLSSARAVHLRTECAESAGRVVRVRRRGPPRRHPASEEDGRVWPQKGLVHSRQSVGVWAVRVQCLHCVHSASVPAGGCSSRFGVQSVTHLTRLETRTKEFKVHASRWVRSPEAQ